jgi:uncharacterized membrane protein
MTRLIDAFPLWGAQRKARSATAMEMDAMLKWFFDGTTGSVIGFVLVALLYIFAFSQTGWLQLQ